MHLIIETEDPLKVLSSTKPIVENLHSISIHEEKLSELAAIIAKKLQDGFDLGEATAGQTTNLTDAVQIIFLQDVVNFCFWAEKDKEKWKIEWPKGTITSGGEFSLRKCFHRALVEKVSILDADYLENITFEQTQHLFRGASATTIPLLKERWQNLREAGKVLNEKYNGKFIHLVEAADYDAVKIITLLSQDFSSFKDITPWQNKEIYFLKRAQLCVKDIASLERKYSEFHIKNTNVLTAFADYKLPQMFRKYGVISFTTDLAQKVDNYVLIPSRSREEIEIRCVTIWCIELIRQKLKKYEATDLAYALWLISQNQSGVKPYHRTYSIYY